MYKGLSSFSLYDNFNFSQIICKEKEMPLQQPHVGLHLPPLSKSHVCLLQFLLGGLAFLRKADSCTEVSSKPHPAILLPRSQEAAGTFIETVRTVLSES